MISARVKIDTRAFESALARYMADSRRAKQTVLRQQAKLCVADIVKITPPKKKSAGDATIRADLAKIFRSSRRGIGSPAGVHKKWRVRKGRVKTKLPREPKDKRIPVAQLIAYRQAVQARVGFLAGGWNAAARELGVRMPQWIARHGTRSGRARIAATSTSMSIRLANAVPYAGDADGLRRRVQWAVNKRTRALLNQLKAYAVKQAARQAGLKSR